MLELVSVKKYYNSNKAVDGISFCLNKGEILGLIGANGAGKSTTISMIATLIKPDFGNIYYQGNDIIKNPSAMRRILGYIPQEIALYPTLSGMDNLLFWGKANHIRGNVLTDRINRVCKLINFSEETLRKKVCNYSGGMKRRLNIGVALLHEPELVIMDEPTVGLDIESRNQILNAVIDLKKQGTTIIYTGHYMNEIEKISDKICIMDRGKVILFGNKETVLEKEISLEQIYLDNVNSK